MPSLNTLRTKGAVVLTIFIFVALLAFIVGDLPFLRNNKMNVGEINGKKIEYTEFYESSDYIGGIFKMMYGTDNFTWQEQQEVYNAAWNEYIMQYSYRPGFQNLGIMVANDEQVDMIDGTYISPVMAQFFTNPNTGTYDVSLMKNFLSQVGDNNNAYVIWNFLKGQMNDNRMTSKYLSLVAGGFYANDLDVAEAVANSANTYEAKVVSQNYSLIADSLVSVSNNEIRNYYSKHKQAFKQHDSRDVDYVVFDVLPSEADFAEAEKEVNKIAREFGAAESPMQYAKLNTHARPDERYFKQEDLSPELAAMAFGRNAGTMVGPTLAGDTYTISRLSDNRMMPDSVGVKYIVLQKKDKQLADSLVRVIRKGSDFATLAREYSLDQSAAQNGGDMGRLATEQLGNLPALMNSLIGARKGEIMAVEGKDFTFVAELTYKSPMIRKAQIATITYKVDASGETMQAAYQRAASLLTAAGGTLEGFRSAASSESIPRRNAHIRNTDMTIGGFENAKELIRWAFTNKKGSVSTVMEIDGDYVVAALTGVHAAGYKPVEEAAAEIRTKLVREAKGRMLAEKMTGASIDDIAGKLGAETQMAENINPNMLYVPPIGFEPRFIGAVTANPAGISKPVYGNTGVFVFTNTDVKASDSPLDPADAKISVEASSLNYVNERTIQALTEETEIKDLRVKFF